MQGSLNVTCQYSVDAALQTKIPNHQITELYGLELEDKYHVSAGKENQWEWLPNGPSNQLTGYDERCASVC